MGDPIPQGDIPLKGRKGEDRMQNLSKFGLMNALLGTINFGGGKTDATIARYLLEHFNSLDELTIYDIAEACYTTRQQVRRFCKRLGLDNFRQFRKEQLAMEYYYANAPAPDYPQQLAGALADMALDVNASSEGWRARFCEQIHMARECVFLVSDIYSSACLEFQKQMILLGKMMRVVSNNFQTGSLFSSLTGNDLVIVVSISGRWAQELIGSINQTSAWRILLTSVTDESLRLNFDDVYHVSAHAQPQVKTAYHQFAIPYLLELVQKRYRDTYLEAISSRPALKTG